MNFAKSPFILQILTFLIYCIGIMFIASGIGLALALIIFGGETLSQGAIIVAQSIIMIFGFGLSGFLFIKIKRKIWAEKGIIINKNNNKKYLNYIYALGLIIAMVPIIGGLSYFLWNINLGETLAPILESLREKTLSQAEIIRTVLEGKGIGILLISIFVVAIQPAICEELLFRGFLQNFFLEWSKNKIHLAIWLSAAIFSYIHFDFFGFVPRLLLGALLGYTYYYSGNILVPMFIHFVNNFIAVFAYYLYQNDMISQDPMSMESGLTFPMWVEITLIFAGIIALFLLIRGFIKYNKNARQNPSKLA